MGDPRNARSVQWKTGPGTSHWNISQSSMWPELRWVGTDQPCPACTEIRGSSPYITLWQWFLGIFWDPNNRVCQGCLWLRHHLILTAASYDLIMLHLWDQEPFKCGCKERGVWISTTKHVATLLSAGWDLLWASPSWVCCPSCAAQDFGVAFDWPHHLDSLTSFL